jgi:hypothetical protein
MATIRETPGKTHLSAASKAKILRSGFDAVRTLLARELPHAPTYYVPGVVPLAVECG